VALPTEFASKMAGNNPVPKDLVTVEQFRRLVQDGQKADLIDGVIHMASPDSLRSNELTGFVESLLRNFTAARELGGHVFVNRFAFELTDYRSPEPDVAYVRPERAHLLTENAMQGGPDIAVEIVSRESRGRDYGEKKLLYQDAGVAEYWIVDPLQRRVEFQMLRSGRYELAPLEANRIHRSTVIPGFWIDVNWLLAEPPPNCYRCLQEILAGAAS
jgi:Uma2 family endonuclease